MRPKAFEDLCFVDVDCEMLKRVHIALVKASFSEELVVSLKQRFDQLRYLKHAKGILS